MKRDRIIDEYFEWLMDLVCGKRYPKRVSYRKLLTYLHRIEFTWSIPKDSNRASDGIKMRYHFALSNGYEDDYDYICSCLDGPCSILEMMVALALRCEKNIMDNPLYGDRTGQWFWGMVVNLGLGSMDDSRFDRNYVDDIIRRFLSRKYNRDGRGGLFTVPNCKKDLRKVEIWYQLCYYLDTIT